MNARLAAIVLAAGVLAGAGRADACSIAGSAAHLIDATRVDTVAPEPPTDVSVVLNRGPYAEGGGCGSDHVSSSCDGIGILQFQLNEPATDDQTAPENMGYLIEVVDGSLPRGLSIPATALRSTLVFSWIDDDADGQEVIAFSVTLTPVDEAGNVGAASDPIRVYDPGSAEGCAMPGRAPSLDAALLLLLATALARASMRRRGAE